MKLKVVCPCSQGCEDAHDSRAWGAAFCPVCENELSDFEAFNSVCEVCDGCVYD